MRAALLDNLLHAHLHLDSRAHGDWGDAVSAVPTVPAEFQAMQACFPIVFRATPDGNGFQSVALLALTLPHNTFVGPHGNWLAAHLPWALERQPLLVGQDGEAWVVHIDLDSPRLSSLHGEALFLPHGGPTALLERRIEVLQALHDGMQALPSFMDALLAHRLLEPLNLDVPGPDGSVQRVAGFSVIHQERLAALPGQAIADLHEAGHLLPIAMAVASMSRFHDLVMRERATWNTPAPASPGPRQQRGASLPSDPPAPPTCN